MFSKLRNPKSQDRKPAASSSPMHKQRTPAATTTKSTSSPSMSQSRKPSFSDHQWEERHWTKPFATGVTQVAATLRFPPEKNDMHDLRRVPEEENLYSKAQKHSSPKFGSPVASTKASASPSSTHSSKCSTKSSASSLKSSASSVKSSASSVKSSASSLKSSASSVKSVASSKSSVTLSSKASASSLWSERPSSSSSNATYATSYSVDSSASTVMTDLEEPVSKRNSNRPDSCTLGDFDAFKLRSLKESKPKRPNSTVSSASGTSCAGTIQSRPRTGKSSKTGDITFEIVAEEDDAIYLQRTPNPQHASRRRHWG